MKPLSLSAKLLLSVWTLLLLALVPTFSYYTETISEDLLTEARADARRSLALLGWLLDDQPAFAMQIDFDRWLKEASGHLGVRITYVVKGKVIADSGVPYAELNNLDDHSSRPEVLASNNSDVGISVRHSATLGKDLVYAATPFAGHPGVPPGVLRVALPFSIVKERQEALTPRLLGFLALAFAFTVVLSLFLTHRFARSIETFSSTARAIGLGDYDQYIRDIPGREFRSLADTINVMARNIKSHITSIEEKKGELEAVFNGMSEGVMVLDAQGRIESWNTALTDIISDIHRYPGKKPLEATMKPELQKAVDALLSSPAGTERMSTDFETSDKRCIQVMLEPFRDMKGVRKIILVFHDISELKRLEAVRRDFVANVSHELKTPVTSIKGFAETLLDQPGMDEEHREKFLRIVLRNADHMDMMVRDLLSLSKLDYKGESPRLAPVCVQDALNHSIKLIEHMAQQKNVAIESELPTRPIRVMGTSEGLHELFKNLLENAVKYGPEDSRITVGMAAQEQEIEICVRDQGPGIPVASRERVFERFYRVGNHPAAKTGSSGLGLSICRNIVDSFGGSIRVECPADEKSGTGSAFCFKLQAAAKE